jgi:hypothetical protein
VAVEVFKALVVHEAVVFRRMGDAGAAGGGFGDQAIDFLAAVAHQADDDFVALGGVDHWLVDQGLEKALGHQHDVHAADDVHESRLLVAVLRIGAEAERGKEGLGLVQVLDRQVEDDLLFHDVSS